jgi:DNA primase
MSLPPGFLDELRSRIRLSAVVGRKVTWDMRKSNQARGDWWAPCPFHQERTASFHVDDRKGFYYCFGCHAKGDALSFVRETGNLGFLEAVEVLAREAGMAMPARDPQAAVRADRRTQLLAVMDEAVRHYRLQLAASGGAVARDYLEGRRRLSPEAQARWSLGWAPDQRTGLLKALTAKGIAPELIEAAGLVAKADDGSHYDRFRGRIVFPIRDARGRTVSLGGRALDPAARAKYLNGPETELFDKGRTLFNLDRARAATGRGAPLILAEGYMDVIALAEAGFAGAVAPLGTAVTEDQLRLAWQAHPEPVVALDGDAAGLRAAHRVIDLALPMLAAGQGLRFALLPGGQDPDDLIRGGGAAAMREVLDAAQPMVRLLWDRERQALEPLDSPERRAALRKRLRAAIQRLQDRDLRTYYAEAFRSFEATELAPRDAPPPFRRRGAPPAKGPPRPQTRASRLAQPGGERLVESLRLEAIAALCLAHPSLADTFAAALETLDVPDPVPAAILRTVLSGPPGATGDDVLARACTAVGRAAVERLLASPHIRVLPMLQGDAALATETLAEQLAKLAADRALRQETEEAEGDMAGLVDEGLTWRLAQAARARAEAYRSGPPPADAAGEDRAALSRALQALIDGEVWRKKPRA